MGMALGEGGVIAALVQAAATITSLIRALPAGDFVLRALRSLLLPLALLWALAYFALGVSLTYLLQCLFLEIVLKIRRSLSSLPHTCEDLKRPALDDVQKALKIRGVQLVAEPPAGQATPPSRRISIVCPKELPIGERISYDDADRHAGRHFGRKPREEAALGVEENDDWKHRVECLREGAEVHRQVRQYVQRRLRPGLQLSEVIELVERPLASVVGFDAKRPLQRGQAFPTGLSLNEVAAHDTVNPGDPARWLRPTDLGKIDFGVQVEGHILDCAFSFAFDPMHDALMQAVQEATNEGIRQAGPDALVSEIGGCIREVMEAGEVHLKNGKVLPVKCIKNLTGHSIAPYKIHAGKGLPSVNIGGRVRMLAGELWAIETFGSAGGVGYVGSSSASGECSHFMRPSGDAPNAMQRNVLSETSRSMLEVIDRRFGTLAFCPRWLVEEASRVKVPGRGKDTKWWASPLDELCNLGVVQRYPPLADLQGSYTAQYEHTILLGSGSKEVLTRGSDY